MTRAKAILPALHNISNVTASSKGNLVVFLDVNQVTLALGFDSVHTLDAILNKIVEFYPQFAQEEVQRGAAFALPSSLSESGVCVGR